MTDKLIATLDKAGVRNISTDLWGIFFEDISYSGDGGLNADLVQNGAFEYSRADNVDWSNYSFWRKIVPEGSFAAFCVRDGDPVAIENPPAGTAWCSERGRPMISPPGCACSPVWRCR